MGNEPVAGRTDTQLVDAARNGDQQAFAELYERYFDPVYDFVARMTRDRDEAADLAQDTFMKAMNALGGLQQGASFKSWIFTIARNTTLNRLERAARTRPLAYQDDEGEDVNYDVVDTSRFTDPEEAAEANAMAALVWEASSGLDPRQLTLLDLHLRQGLDSAEIAGVMGVTKNNGYVMLNRLKKAVEESIGAFIMLHNGRKHCASLDMALTEAGLTTMTPRVRKLVDRHVAQCEDCGGRRKKLLSPLSIFGAFAPVGAPVGLREALGAQLAREWPGPPATGTGYAGDGGAGAPPPPIPFPPPSGGDGAGPGFWRGRVAQVAVGAASIAAVLGVLLLVPESPFALTSRNGGDTVLPAAFDADGATPATSTPAAVLPTEGGTPTSGPADDGNGGDTPTATASEMDGATPGPETTVAGASAPSTATATASPSPAGTATVTPTGATSTPTTTTPTSPASPTSTATATFTPSPTPTTALCAPRPQSNVAIVNVGARTTAQFTLLNRDNCAADISLSVSGGPWLSISSPTSFTLAPSATATVTIQVDRTQLSPGVNRARVVVSTSPGGYVFEVGVDATGPTPTPVAPTATPVTPTATPQPPSILSASGCVTPGAASASFTVNASGSAGITQVTVAEDSPGQNSVNLIRTGGSAANGTWTGSMTYQTFVQSFTATAHDAAQNTATASITQYPLPLCP